MKEIIKNLIKDYVKEYEQKAEISTKWREPLVGFASSNHPNILQLKDIVTKNHEIPSDVLENHKTIIAYFIPFDMGLAKTNNGGKKASSEWALAYEETNTLFTQLNKYIIKELNKMGYEGGVSPQAITYDEEILKSKWSQRHIAKVAGLGNFGINNMLITQKGCCGRISTVVTDLEVEYDKPVDEEYCLYKIDGSCGACVKKCPGDALTTSNYDRHKCHDVCESNAKIYTEFGSSYALKPDSNMGSYVCGKCLINVPCSFTNPKNNKM